MGELERLLDSPRDEADLVLAELVAIDASGDEAAALAALAALARRPHAVIRLDAAVRRVRQVQRVRRVPWWSRQDHTDLQVPGTSSRRAVGVASPLGIALAGAHGDGRVRERAVQEIIARPRPDLAPFLVLRTGDWVREVRDRARAGLAVLLHEDPAAYLPAVMGVALRVERWSRGSFVGNQLLAAAADPRARLERLLDSPEREVRAFAYAAGTWPLDRRLSIALSAPDVRLRSRAAEAVARDAVWTGRVGVLRRLAASRHAEVRAQGVIGLVRSGHDAEVAARLDDKSSVVRATARAAALRVGVDAAEHYRSRVTRAAIDGFAELGGDGRHLVELLAHPSPGIRARAVRALRVLDQVPEDRVLPLLRDPSPAVVREALSALRAVPPELAWELLGDERPAVRLAGYRLALRQGPAAELRAGLLALADPHDRLARRARMDVVRMSRALAPMPWQRRPVVPLETSPADAAGLRVLLDRAAAALDEQTVHLLRRHLT